MAKPTEAHLQAAKRLLRAPESAGGGDARERAASAGLVYETLFKSLAPVIGEAGMRALLARSLKLTQAEFPCLAEILLTESPSGSVPTATQLISCLSKLEPAAASEVATGLYATFLGLMTNFIGDQLVRQIVKGAFHAIDEAVPKETS